MNPILLIVDDEPAGRESLESVLITQEYTLVFASNGVEALSKAREVLPDVILLDVMMPDMDGFEVCRRLRGDIQVADVPVLMVTALDDRDSRLRGLEAGADDFISKPIDRVELRARVRSITRLNRYRRLQDEREKLKHQLEVNAHRTQELELLANLSSEMRRVVTRPEMMNLILDHAVQDTHAQAGALMLLVGDGLVVQSAQGFVKDWETEICRDRDSHFWDVIRSGESEYNRACPFNQHCCYQQLMFEGNTLSSCITTPLKSSSNTIGLLFLGFDRAQSFNQDQKRLVTAIAEIAGNALRRMMITEELESLVEHRTRELDSIYQVTSAASSSMEISEAFKSALDLTVRAVESTSGLVFLCDAANEQMQVLVQVGLSRERLACVERQGCGSNLEKWVIQNKQILLIPDLSTDPLSSGDWQPGDYLTFIGIPMQVRGDVVGVLEIFRPGGINFSVDERTLLSFIGDHLGLVVENHRLYRQSEKNAIEEERSRLARELHDSVTQMLFSAMLFSNGAKKLLKVGQTEKVQQYLDQIEQVTQQALKEMRLMVFQLRLASLQKAGLANAIQNRLDSVERRSGINTNLEVSGIEHLPSQVEETLYRVTLEALNNSLKHSSAANIDIKIHCISGLVTLTVHDDGIGFNLIEGEQNGGVGLTSMRERVERVGGEIQFISKKGCGTTVIVTVQVGEGKR